MPLKPRAVDFSATWNNLQTTVEKILTLSKLDKSVWNNSFDDVYFLCVAVPNNFCDSLYEETKKFFEKHTKEIQRKLSQIDDGFLLEEYIKQWDIYHKGATYVHILYKYLNDQHIKRKKQNAPDYVYGGLPLEHNDHCCHLEIGELALETWQRLLLESLKGRIVGLVLNAISAYVAYKDRHGHVVDSTVIRGVIHSFVEVEEYKLKHPLKLYQNGFEKPFLQATSDHYKKEASKLLAECTCSEYMEKVIAHIEEETERSLRFLHSSSHEKGLSVLVKEFENRVKKIGLDAVKNLPKENTPTVFVEKMLEVHHTHKELVLEVFKGSQEFCGALDKACLTAINYKESENSCPKASEWLARYTDMLLRKGGKGLTEAQIDEQLQDAITIFRYIEDKDVFQKFYAQRLAHRLIYSVSISMEAEEAMITKLKLACGYEFTSKLHRMFTDMGLSKSLTHNFDAHLASEGRNLNLGFSILVLQAGAWPISTQNQCNFIATQCLQQSIQLFDEFYKKSYNGRKLSWLYNFSYADLRANYLDKPYVITTSVYQMAILLLFNSEDTLSLSYIMASTELSNEVVVRTVKTLLDASILLSSTGDQVDENTGLSLNLSFTNKRTKFKLLNPVIQRQGERETEQVKNTIQQDRKHFLECTVVRVMKARKILKHNILVQEVINQSVSRFTPEVPFIKKIIEQLIEKQYLQRTENPDEYSYLA